MSNFVNQKLADFFGKYPEVKFSAGEAIIHPEKIITNVYFLKAGSAKMYAVSDEGKELTLTILSENSFFPTMLLLSDVPNKYFFSAQSEVVVNKAPAADVINFLKSEPEVLFNLTTRFASAINGLTNRVVELSFSDAYSKIYNFLLYLEKKESSKTLFLTHEELANWLGLSRETVSRQLEKMQEQGLLTIKNKQLTLIR